MMVGIGPEFLRLLTEIEWDTLTARDAVQLRAALQEALARSNVWFGQLSKDFGPPAASIYKDGAANPPVAPPAKVEGGRPPAEATPPRPKPTVRAKVTLKRKRGRPLARRARPNPIEIGGANAATATGPAAAKLFENSYVSKDGPRADIPATLPADHPRMNLHRESSVTPEVDAQDFKEVERAMASGRGVKDIFQVR